jgi:uncharacterized protein YecE (DUF72 family)
MCAKVRIGTAGWSIPTRFADAFPGEGTHLQRYSRLFDAAEINSSFHRPHRPATYARWAASVPDGFRFAVKVPKAITHALRLAGAEPALDRFAAETAGLGDRLGPVLVQLPPKLAFEADLAAPFFGQLRARFPGPCVCEPRHPSWFDPDADALLAALEVARVAADPARVPAAAEPGGWRGLAYYRLHGAPRTYYSAYEDDQLATLAARIRAHAGPVWCIFDNTASGAAAGNALDLARRRIDGPMTAEVLESKAVTRPG